jgi:hypothetical protein
VDAAGLPKEVPTMAKTRQAYATEFRQRLVELVRAGTTANATFRLKGKHLVSPP